MSSAAEPLDAYAELCEECLYVYGIVERTRVLPTFPSNPRLELITVGGLSAVHTSIDPAELDDLSADLSEGSRLAVLARQHDEIVRYLANDGPVLPVRLGTLCPDAAWLRQLLQDGEEHLAAELERVRGRSEWDLRVRAIGPDGSIGVGSGVALSNTEYLMQPRQLGRFVTELPDSLVEALRAVDEALSGLADAVGGPGLSNLTMSMSRAYLVAHDAEADFVAAATEATAELEARGCTPALYGPLPAYSFVDVRLEASGHA